MIARVSLASAALWTALIALSLTLAPAPAARADTVAEARALVEKMIGDTYDVLTDGGLDDRGKFAQLQAALEPVYDVATFDRRLLGSATRKRMSDAQQAEFKALLPNFLTGLFKERFSMDLQGPAEVVDAQPFKDKGSIVTVRVPRANGQTLPVQLYVSTEVKIIDSVSGGVSQTKTQRSEFTNLVERQGADALLAYMKGKISDAGGV